MIPHIWPLWVWGVYYEYFRESQPSYSWTALSWPSLTVSSCLLYQMMKVKLQPPSATDLPAHNPILPPAAITQVMLIANPHKVRTQIETGIWQWYSISHKMYPWFLFWCVYCVFFWPILLLSFRVTSLALTAQYLWNNLEWYGWMIT